MRVNLTIPIRYLSFSCRAGEEAEANGQRERVPTINDSDFEFLDRVSVDIDIAFPTPSNPSLGFFA